MNRRLESDEVIGEEISEVKARGIAVGASGNERRRCAQVPKRRGKKLH